MDAQITTPYKGLQLNRFPYTIKSVVNPTDAALYEQNGGKWDSCGVWGLTPEQFVDLIQEFSPSELGTYCTLVGRTDYDYVEILRIRETTEIKSLKAFHAYKDGADKLKFMNAWSVNANWHPFKAHKKSWQQVVDYVNNNKPRLVRSIEKMGLLFFTEQVVFTSGSVEFRSLQHEKLCPDVLVLSRHDEDMDGYTVATVAKGTPLYKKLLKCGQAHRIGKTYYRERDTNTKFFSAKAEAYAVNHDCQQSSLKYKKNYMSSERTTIGRIIVGNHGLYLNGTRLLEKTVARDYKVTKIDGVLFVWKSGNFSTHREFTNTSVKEALAMYIANTPKVLREGDALTLNDVRNDVKNTLGYCLAGTKDFAEHRMPFLYRMIAGYSSWSDIPVEILTTPFYVTKETFKGFRNVYV